MDERRNSDKDTMTKVKLPTLAARDAMVRRYLKPDQNIDWRREMPAFVELFKRYPSVEFWTHHELPFKLNHMSWFTSIEGAVQLESDWSVFHYHPSEPASNTVLDINLQSAYNGNSVATPPPRPVTVAQFLSQPK